MREARRQSGPLAIRLGGTQTIPEECAQMQFHPKPLPRPRPKPERLGERKRMTIALGILASDGIVLAADTQETAGYFKGFALKIHSAMTKTNIHSNVNSALAITGSGHGVY